jgi:hypothetical protein
MKARKQQTKREGPQSNRIALPFEKAVEGLLQVKPKKKPAKRKKKTNK